MKASGAMNRYRKQIAETRKHGETYALPRKLSYLSPDLAKRAKELMDLVVYEYLPDPERESTWGEAPNEE